MWRGRLAAFRAHLSSLGDSPGCRLACGRRPLTRQATFTCGSSVEDVKRPSLARPRSDVLTASKRRPKFGQRRTDARSKAPGSQSAPSAQRGRDRPNRRARGVDSEGNATFHGRDDEPRVAAGLAADGGGRENCCLAWRDSGVARGYAPGALYRHVCHGWHVPVRRRFAGILSV
jgi:hypothetical protein